MKNLVILLILCFACSQQAEAQFFKKIKDKIEGKNNTETQEETTEETETNTQDSPAILNMGNMFGSLEDVPESYNFSYEYELTINDHKGRESTITYLLPTNKNYFAFRDINKKTESIFVYDNDLGSTVMFMNDDGNKTVMSMKLPNEMVTEAFEEQFDESNMPGNVSMLPPKTILGRQCKGYRYEDDEMISKFWITNTEDLSFYNVFTNQKGVKVNSEWAKIVVNSLVMEMQYESKTKKKDNMVMQCTRLDQTSNTVQKANYSSLF